MQGSKKLNDVIEEIWLNIVAKNKRQINANYILTRFLCYQNGSKGVRSMRRLEYLWIASDGSKCLL